jgi:hypothetical protein
MRLPLCAAAGLIVLAACTATPIRGPDSVEHLCFGFLENSKWSTLDSQSMLAAELKMLVTPYAQLVQRQSPPREVVIVSPRKRHAALCRLDTLPSGKGCVAEKWYLYLDA